MDAILQVIRRLRWLPVIPGLMGVFTCTFAAAIYYRTDPDGAAVFAVIGLVMIGVTAVSFRTIQHSEPTGPDQDRDD
jgi:uncharacterized membrane protein YdcZ (DUF606 family)